MIYYIKVIIFIYKQALKKGLPHPNQHLHDNECDYHITRHCHHSIDRYRSPGLITGVQKPWIDLRVNTSDTQYKMLNMELSKRKNITHVLFTAIQNRLNT